MKKLILVIGTVLLVGCTSRSKEYPLIAVVTSKNGQRFLLEERPSAYPIGSMVTICQFDGQGWYLCESTAFWGTDTFVVDRLDDSTYLSSQYITGKLSYTTISK